MKDLHHLTLAAIAATCLFSGSPVHARLQVDGLFSQGMILQSGMTVPIQGKARSGSNIEVSFGGQSVSGATDDDGNWKVMLEPLESSSQGRTLVIAGDGGKIEIDDVLVGEVWLCSGQSNMQYSMKQTEDGIIAAREANDPLLRWFARSQGGR